LGRTDTASALGETAISPAQASDRPGNCPYELWLATSGEDAAQDNSPRRHTNALLAFCIVNLIHSCHPHVTELTYRMYDVCMCLRQQCTWEKIALID